ncbi:hypothetical protein BSN85_21705 [Bradyrhizobium brasilense]|nr:hypothetical protein BSN85_21705 [Bradyrhizobium brasilense]
MDAKPQLIRMFSQIRNEPSAIRSCFVRPLIGYSRRGHREDFARFLDDGRICMNNNCAERALRGIVLESGTGASPAASAAPTRPPSC